MEQREGKGGLKRGWHCVREIHYQVVMPVKYLKALIEQRVQRVLEETTEGIGERYEIEMEG